MGRSALQYRTLLQNFLPRGRAWTRDKDAVLTQLLHAFGEEFARFEIRIEDLLKESILTTTSELLEEYEEEYGIPDPFRSLSSTIEGRKEDLLAKMLAIGAQHAQYYIDIAKALGYNITFEFFIPAIVGYFSSGDPCGPSENIFYWLVRVDVNGNRKAFDWSFESNAFDCVAGNSYDYILSLKRSYSSLWYEINRLKPAHTIALFDWGQRPFNRAFGWAFECFPSYDGSVVSCGFDGAFSSSFGNNHDYDGEYLVGAFSQGFSLDFDAYFGGDLFKREFDSAFARPM